jgi:Ca-activated chloride channel family protein
MNQQLVQNRQEPLYAVYPVDGLAIADSPLGFVNKGNADKEAVFLKLQQYLLSAPVQDEILAKGRRAGLVGLNPNKADKSVFNPDWGIDVTRVLNPIKFPNAQVIGEALDLYQTTLRKASLTTYCLDYSPSMRDNQGYQQLLSALDLIWNQDQARKYLLQASSDDLTMALLFGGDVFNYNRLDQWTVRGNNSNDFNRMLKLARETDASGSTAIYSCVLQALKTTRAQMSPDRFPAVILMTDGQNNAGATYDDLERYVSTTPNDIPVFTITFGSASTKELERITTLTHGRLYDGTKDLITAFRQAKGNN